MPVTSRRPSARTVATILAVTALVACSSSGPPARPHTPATLQITAPEPNAVTGPDLEVRVLLRHAHLVPGTQIGGTVDPHEGHIHVSVDGRLIAMINRPRVPLIGLSPGEHTVQAEFVASDHLPFANSVDAAVSFTVG